ncbi:hypothetical protein [Leptospira sarikeiensis]|uniref:Lipoprotein n=1 Tax=Leptospira sarikeiensis TaxID=2484943 RepID=A0A4V3JRL5_9LEPT|nr:hypothetical protein [Leptospira sarikeiensis]TGL60742.1 hypothetical protein EHQ64_13065 [Leptospira sarikeiensis]
MKVRNYAFYITLIFSFLSCGSDPVKRCEDRRKVMRDAVCQAVGAHEPGTQSYNDILTACLLESNHFSDCQNETYF